MGRLPAGRPQPSFPEPVAMLNGRPILIVEDEAVIALDLWAAVQDAGGAVIGPVATVHQAFHLLGCRNIDAAIVDANLADGDLTPLALELYRKNIPFVVHTARGLPPGLAATLPRLPVIMKPAEARIVVEKVAALLAEKRS